ncbi:Histone-lysine N-methyltransferase, H3 lysine-9 specific SUVH4 [Linum grandiflorum]
MRPDLKAATKMLKTDAILYPKRRIGNLPGIEVGHQFYSRAEMVVIGIHSHWLCGIDYIGASFQKEYQNYKLPLAVSIVLSGMYEDDLDNADEVSYTGHGGHNLSGDKRQCKDQVMERGNLALKHCVEQSVPVRVIRGHVCKSSYVGKIYTYDGLYKVEKYWAEKGISGFTVFKYGLKRLKEQPILTTNQVQFTNGRVPQAISDIRGLVCDDITGGLEDVPIPATNLVDDPPVPPTGFTYLKTNKIAKSVKLPKTTAGCNCEGTCVDPRTCACAKLNGSDFPYVHRDGGRLIEAKDVVFECGPSCGCGLSCVNRASQRGLRYRLEVFRSPKKGWGVRSWDFIYAGSPVCEYVGVLKKTEDVDSLTGNDYIFEIDCLQTMRGLGGRERRSRDASLPDIKSIASEESKSDSIPEFCIDAGPSGNVARFINHSCSPNLFVQCVLSSHRDLRLARVVLFAADNIPPLQELTYDYGYALDSVTGPDGKIKRVPCYCGGSDCRKRLY